MVSRASGPVNTTNGAPASTAAGSPPPPVMAAEVCAKMDLPYAARTLLREGMTGRAFVEALLDKNHNVPAIDFLAHALGPRETIWWGCLCMQHALGDKLPGPDKAAARATVIWVMKPTEENRAAAKAAAPAVGTSIAARLAQAVGQITSPPAAPGGEWARTVAAAVRLASGQFESRKIKATQGQFASLGLVIAGKSLG